MKPLLNILLTPSKKIFLVLVFALLSISPNIQAQCTGDITLTSQEEIDNFATNYGCTEIEGSLTIEEAQGGNITNLNGLNNLTSVGGYLNIENNSALTNLDGLESVSSIGESLVINTNYNLMNLLGLQNLSSIEGALSLYYNYALTNLDGLQNLSSVGGINLYGNFLNNLVGLQNISSIEGSLYIDKNDYLTNVDGLQNLSSIGGFLLIGSSVSLTNMDSLANISSIGEDLTIHSNASLTNLDGLQNLSSIGGDLTIYNNNSLISLASLENFSSIGGGLLIQGNVSLTDLDGFENLSSIGNGLNINNNNALTNLDGFENLSSIGNGLNINNNNALTNLDGLQNLLSIDEGLSIWNNDALTSLASFDNLSSIGESLEISYNDALTSLAGFENLSLIGGELKIYNNPLLNSCCSILEIADVVEGEITIYDNFSSCNSIDEIIHTCADIYEEIKVQAFFDENENGVFDSNENPMYESFNLEPSAIYSFSDEDGVGHLFLEDYGVYQISINNLDPLWSINGEDTIQIEYLDALFTDTLHYFPLIPDAEFIIQNIDIASSITRCNRETNYWLSYTNQGTTINSGYIELIPDELATFVSSNPPVDSIAGDTLYWFYEDLYPSHTNQIHVVYEMPGVAEFGEEIIGDEIVFEAVTQVETEAGGKIGRKTISSELVCAYDPNDKLVTPSGYGEENYTLFGDTLEYVIRFQNTGNDTAFTVIIEDELSEFLDLNTFQPIASSHAVETQIDIETRIVTFTFDDIYLPDSVVNEAGSHGFVKYRIQGNEDLEENTQIENTASIFFDSNPAIVTNTVSNEMISVLPILPVMNVSPNELNFGELILGESDTLVQTLVISNIGTLPLEISSFDFENAVFNSGEIQMAIIEGQSSLEVPIYFAPDEVGFYESELVLQSNAGSLSIVLNGTAILNTGICTGDITLTSQEEIDNFATNYGCSIIEGNLTIEEAEDGNIVNLNGLSGLTSINGDLSIKYNSALTTIDGLESLSSIEGNLSIVGNFSLLNIDGLQNLSLIGGDLWIGINLILTNLSGLQNLSSVGGALGISDNNVLTNLNGLQNISFVGEEIFVTANESLINLDGLQNFSFIQGLRINDNESLTNLDGLENLSSIGEFLVIRNNDALTNLDQLQNLSSIGGDLEISSNLSLTNIDGLQNVSSIGKNIRINHNKSLTNVDGLQNISFIEGNLFIDSNYPLTNLAGLENVSSISENLHIANSYFTDMVGLENLSSIGGDLHFYENISLISLTSFENLSSIGGNLIIEGNHNLTNLIGLENVSSIGGDLSIYNNSSLTSLNGLENVSSIGGNLSINHNSFLNFCCPVIDMLDRSVYINNNLPSCNSVEAIIDTCNVINSIENIALSKFKVFPNPNEGRFYLDAKGGKIVSYQIYNVLGEVILSAKTVTDFALIDMQKQSKGVYFLSIETEEGVFVEKIVVQ